MIRPHLRNRKKELEFMHSDDVSECPYCGNWNMWHSWNKEGDLLGIVCTNCGWVCGDEKFREVIELRYKEIEREKEREGDKMPYRHPGCIEQIYYIIRYTVERKSKERRARRTSKRRRKHELSEMRRKNKSD